MKTSNSACSAFVSERVPFTANNIFGQNWAQGIYVVFSYGTHWPLFVYDSKRNKWYSNSSKYGVTTSKHYGQAHPRGVECEPRTVAQLVGALNYAQDISRALEVNA